MLSVKKGDCPRVFTVQCSVRWDESSEDIVFYAPSAEPQWTCSRKQLRKSFIWSKLRHRVYEKNIPNKREAIKVSTKKKGFDHFYQRRKMTLFLHLTWFGNFKPFFATLMASLSNKLLKLLNIKWSSSVFGKFTCHKPCATYTWPIRDVGHSGFRGF